MNKHSEAYILRNIGGNTRQLSKLFVHLADIYPKLAYHNYRHALEVAELALVEYFYVVADNDSVRSRTLAVAALFHDVVYNIPARYPGANEDDSFEMLRQYNEVHDLGIDIALAEVIIKATKHDKFDESLPIEAKIVCDADLIGLSSTSTEYRANTLRIMTEYETSPDFSVGAFYKGRLMWLDLMNRRDNIYYIHIEYNHSARLNMADEYSVIKNFIGSLAQK